MDYIFGYGSLLSEYSRRHYSNIQSDVKAATLYGWNRAWCASYPDEGATYAGALRHDGGQLDGVLINSEVNEVIAERERGYQFTRLNLEELVLSDTGHEFGISDRIWICESLTPLSATRTNPLPQSYVDTCISGCMEFSGLEGAARFIQQTIGWDCVWLNDRQAYTTPIYPRYAKVSLQQSKVIDSLLDEQGVLKFRQT